MIAFQIYFQFILRHLTVKTWNYSYFISEMMVLRFEFQKFRNFKILNFDPWVYDLNWDQEVPGLSFTRGPLICPLARLYFLISTNRTQDTSWHYRKLVDWDVKHQIKKPMYNKYIYIRCLSRDWEAMGSSITGVTAFWSLSKTHLS